MLDELIAYARDVHKAVLMNADINERTEVNYVTYCTRHNHTGFERVNVENIVAKNRSIKAIADIASGLFKLFNDIVQGRLADAELLT